MKKTLILSFLCYLFLICNGQKNRYRFAASYFGVESEYLHETNDLKFIDKTATLNHSKLSSSISPRIIIGGTHFWGRADFYLSVPLANINLASNAKASISNGVLTGFRYIPFALKSSAIRAYLGAGFNAKSFRQEAALSKGAIYSNWQVFQELGAVFYLKPNTLIEFGARYFPKNSYQSYLNRSIQNEVLVSPFSFSFSLKKMFDFTNGYSSKESQLFVEKLMERARRENKLNNFSVGIGLSALIPLSETERASRLAFFNDEIESTLNLDLSLEYYLQKINASVRLSFRNLKQEETAHAYSFSVKRNSSALEVYKFIYDFHGFVPFIGPYVSYDNYDLKELDNNKLLVDYKSNEIGYGLVFGWDIQQTKYDFITLRTNLRYTPELNIKYEGLKISAQQLEFNFIQVVFYPERYKLFKQMNQS